MSSYTTPRLVNIEYILDLIIIIEGRMIATTVRINYKTITLVNLWQLLFTILRVFLNENENNSVIIRGDLNIVLDITKAFFKQWQQKTHIQNVNK